MIAIQKSVRISGYRLKLIYRSCSCIFDQHNVLRLHQLSTNEKMNLFDNSSIGKIQSIQMFGRRGMYMVGCMGASQQERLARTTILGPPGQQCKVSCSIPGPTTDGVVRVPCTESLASLMEAKVQSYDDDCWTSGCIDSCS